MRVKANQGFIFILMALVSGLITTIQNFMPYFLLGLGIARLNHTWVIGHERKN